MNKIKEQAEATKAREASKVYMLKSLGSNIEKIEGFEMLTKERLETLKSIHKELIDTFILTEFKLSSKLGKS